MSILTKVAIALCLSTGLTTAAAAQNVDVAIAKIKKATEQYNDVNVALADGYIPDPSGHCVSAEKEGLPPEWGSMGLHYLNMAALKITTGEPRVDGQSTHTDFMKPAILLYEPQVDGSLERVGVENVVFQKAWHAAGNSEPPSFEGRIWDTMADDPATAADEAHMFEPHFDQHVWFRENPAGALAPFNPNVTCEHHMQ